jgi:hypothetical protein
MRRAYLAIFSLLLAAGFWGEAFAQQTPVAKQDDGCSQFKMRVVRPENETMSKLIVVKPAEGIDAKGKVINPCNPQEQKSAGMLSAKPGHDGIPAFTTPPLRLLPGSENEVKPQAKGQVEFQLPPLKNKWLK